MSRKGTLDVFQSKYTRNDRFAQMTHQEMVIEQKKREIQAKIEQKQKVVVPVASTTTSPAPAPAPSTPPVVKTPKVVTPSASTFSFNTFSNDGSFLDQFKRKVKKPEAKQKIFFKNSNNGKGHLKDVKDKKSTDTKVSEWSVKKDSKPKVSRFSERPTPQFDNKICVPQSYSNIKGISNFDVKPQNLVSNMTLVSPQSVTGQPLLKNSLMSPSNIGIANPPPSLNDINLMTTLQQNQDVNLITTLQQNQVNMNEVISTINEFNMGINTNINVMSNISTTPMILNMPPPSVNVLVSISEPPPLMVQTTLPSLVSLTVNLPLNQNLLPPEQLNVLTPMPQALPTHTVQSLPSLSLSTIPTLELSSIPPPNPIQIHNIPQPEPMNTLSIPPPAPLQVQNIPPPSPLQLTEIPNPKPMDLMNIPTPTEGLHSTDYITSIPPPNKSIPPPHTAGMSDLSAPSAMSVNVSVPPPCTTASVAASLSRLQHNVSIPPPMPQPPPPTLQQTIRQQVRLPPPPQTVQQQQQAQARLVATTPPPIQPSPIPPPALSMSASPIPALMAHPILPPPPPQSATSTNITGAILVQHHQHQQQQQHNMNVAAAMNKVSRVAPAAPPPPLNMTCPPPAMLVEFERARMEKTQQQQSGVLGVGPAFARNMNAVFTAGSVEFEAMAQMARVVARCGNSVQDVLLQRKPRDPDLWFLHQPHDSPIYRQYRQLVEQFRAELAGSDVASLASGGPPVKVEESKRTDDYRPEDIYDPDDAIADEDECAAIGIGGPGFGSGSWGSGGGECSAASSVSAEERRKRKRKSRWGQESILSTSLPSPKTSPPIAPPQQSSPLILPSHVVPTTSSPASANPMLSKLTRTDPALLQYAQQTFGSIQLSEEDWKKAEDHYKINLLYQDMLRKRQEIERMQKAGKFKYDYDSDEEVDEVGPGTWEHKLREKEMTATTLWAAELTKQAAGKHHIGDFLPPEEYKKFMEKSQAAKEGRTLDISDYKEFKLKEDNVGFKMLQKLGWSEGQGLGADGSGIVEPVNKSSQRDMNQGLGVGDDNLVANDDDEYDSYRKRMMLAYRFRPNPLNNPRRPYY